MCIRDSYDIALDVTQVGAQQITAATTITFTAKMAGQTFIPVSYTHLRAHETVLDIVCRLLLEKKTIT